MPSYRSWIGDKHSAGFYWDDIPEEAHKGNQPNWKAPSAKHWYRGLGFGYGLYKILEKEGRYSCRQLDWGGWGILVSREDCLEIWDKYGSRRPGSKTDERHAEIRAEIARLAPDKEYVLFIAEQP